MLLPREFARLAEALAMHCGPAGDRTSQLDGWETPDARRFACRSALVPRSTAVNAHRVRHDQSGKAMAFLTRSEAGRSRVLIFATAVAVAGIVGTRPGRVEAIRDRDLAAVSAKLRAHGLAAGLRARARSVHQRRLRRAAERGQEEYSGSHETPHAPRVPYPHRRGCFPAGTPKRTVRAHGCETDRLSQPHNSQIQELMLI